MADVEHRVSVIEEDLKEIAYAQRKTEMSLQRLSEEMREFKSEMSAFKDEMSDFKDEMSAFKDEMSDFKDEMSDFKGEMRADRKEINRQWGYLANKMGTLVEDIILPGFPGILKRYFDTEAELIMPRPRRRDPNDKGRMREFDIIAIDETRVFVNETKSKPSLENARAFIENYDEVLTYFPDYSDLTIVPIYSALMLPDDVVDLLSSNGCYAVALGDEHLEILNFHQVAAP